MILVRTGSSGCTTSRRRQRFSLTSMFQGQGQKRDPCPLGMYHSDPPMIRVYFWKRLLLGRLLLIAVAFFPL